MTQKSVFRRSLEAVLLLTGLLLLSFSSLFLSAEVVGAQTYLVEDYDVIEGTNSGFIPITIDNNGNVLVSGLVDNGVDSFIKSYLLQNGQYTDLGSPFGQRELSARDMNELGQVVGRARNNSGNFEAFLWEGGVYSYFTPSPASAINNNSEFALQGAVWNSEGELYSLENLPSASRTGVRALNDNGYAVGITFDGRDRPAYWVNGEIFVIGDGRSGQALDINNSNHITGIYSGAEGWLAENGAITQTFDGRPIALNENGEVLVASSTSRAFSIWTADGGFEPISNQIIGLPNNFSPYAMNDSGDIVGTGRADDGSRKIVLLKKQNISTKTLATTHDTYSTTFAPGKQKGSEDWIRVQDVNKASHQYKHMHRGFAQVDTTSIQTDATVATATMRMYVSEAAKPGSVMVQLPATTWNESTLTMNNVPDVDFAPVALIDIEATDVGTYIELDVTDLVSNWVSGSTTNNGVMLSPLGTAVEFGTKESGQPITIDVTYEVN